MIAKSAYQIVHPLLDLGEGEIVGAGDSGGGGLAFEDVNDCGGLAAGSGS
jgi:hypothetical protein